MSCIRDEQPDLEVCDRIERAGDLFWLGKIDDDLSNVDAGPKPFPLLGDRTRLDIDENEIEAKGCKPLDEGGPDPHRGPGHERPRPVLLFEPSRIHGLSARRTA